MSIESVMPFNHLILCCPLLLLPSIFPSIRVFSNELALHIKWEKIRAPASASVFPMNIQGWFPLGSAGLISLQSEGFQESSPAPQFKGIKSSMLSLLYGPSLTSIHDYWKKLQLRLIIRTFVSKVMYTCSLEYQWHPCCWILWILLSVHFTCINVALNTEVEYVFLLFEEIVWNIPGI